LDAVFWLADGFGIDPVMGFFLGLIGWFLENAFVQGWPLVSCWDGWNDFWLFWQINLRV